MTKKVVAIYLRVSTKQQDTKSQEPELKHWAKSQDQPYKVFRDKATGKNMNRPGWKNIEKAIRMGQVSSVVVWRLDRLGRTASGLTALFEELTKRNINLISLKDGIDLQTAAGRLMANVLASVSVYDNEIRSERILAGQAVARAAGKSWGGSKPGVRRKVTRLQEKIIRRMKNDGESIVAIAKSVSLSRPTVYSVLEDSQLKCRA